MMPAGNDFDDSLIEHAARCWDAECENADRISKERHLLLSVLIAFLGFGLFKVEWLQAVVSKTALTGRVGTLVAIVIAILLIAATYYFVRALFALAHRPSRTSASESLSLPERAYVPAGAIDKNEQKRLAFEHIGLTKSFKIETESLGTGYRTLGQGLQLGLPLWQSLS